MLNMLMNKVEDIKGGGNGNPPEPKEKPKEDIKKDESNPQGEGDIEYDELGYAKPKDDKSEPKKESKKDDEKEKLEDSTGYEKDIPAPKKEDTTGYTDDDNEEEVGDDKEKSKDESEELELDVKDLLPEEVKEIKEIAKELKLNKEQAQKLANKKKAEVQALKVAMKKQQKDQEEAVKETKRKWRKELVEDSTFGGENFDKNIHKVNKIVQEFLPNTKKMLTERGSMLPPYVMRDLVKLADHLYRTENLVNGDPSVPKKNDEDSDNPLDFYNS